MARLSLQPVLFSAAGLRVDASSSIFTVLGANTGVSFVNSGNVVLLVSNASGANLTVTENIGRLVEGQQPPPIVPALQATATVVGYGPWKASNFNASDGSGLQYIDFTGTLATVGVALVEIPFLGGQ